MKYDPIAAKLNATLDDSIVGQVLSSYGRRAFFPKGIIAQSQEAAGLAGDANATAGVALESGHYMTHSLFGECVPFLSADALVAYAPVAGDPLLRSLWQEEMVRKNPSLANATCSVPVVTAGLTHGIAIAADLFVDRGDAVIVPSPSWDNYDLIFSVNHGADLHSPTLFDDQLRWFLDDLEHSMRSISSEKIVLLLNAPNNPTGYTPSEQQIGELVDLLIEVAKTGKYMVVIVDDAYFGLFHDETACRHSLFSRLCDAHERILAIKCDAATKESLSWGLRVGFITYGAKGLTNAGCHAMVQKTMGVIRASVSSCSRASQSLLLAAMQDPRYHEETGRVAREMARRFSSVRKAVDRWSDSSLLRLYPCNSGYFCSFACSGDAESLRRHLLDAHGIGTVALPGNLLRIAYSGVDIEALPRMIEEMYQGAGELWT